MDSEMDRAECRPTRIGQAGMAPPKAMAWLVGLAAFALFGCLFVRPGDNWYSVYLMLQLDRTRVPTHEIARIARAASLVWYLLPAAGLLFDRCSAVRQKRREILAGSAAIAAVALIVLRFSAPPSGILLSLGFLLTGSMAAGGAIAGGILFDRAAAENRSGSLSAALILIWCGVSFLLMSAMGPVRGFTHELAFFAAVWFFLFVISIGLTWRDSVWEDIAVRQPAPFAAVRGCAGYWLALAAWLLLAPFTFAAYSPGATSTWELRALEGAVGFAAVVYLLTWRRMPLRQLLYLAIAASVAEAFIQHAFRIVMPSIFVLGGCFLGAWALLAILHLLIYSTPRDFGAFSYGLVMVVWAVSENLFTHAQSFIGHLNFTSADSAAIALHLAAAGGAALIVWALLSTALPELDHR
ncbi:MAG TPA: hypothetical protein VFJ58_07785 [Armatimonadota bacterium]|nr:hypothetical protein [Armatimonadota bacterium]